MRLWIVVGLLVSSVCFGSEDREGLAASRRVPPIARGHEAFYERFLNGVLIYKPHKDSDFGRIDLPIRELADPLDGTFDLSSCGETWKYMSIHTGYKKAKIPANSGKTEIWITPKFLVEANLGSWYSAGDARWMKDIVGSWTHPWGMFWTWGEDGCKGDNFDYLLRSDILEDKGKNLYDDWCHGSNIPPSPRRANPVYGSILHTPFLENRTLKTYFVRFD